MVPAQGFFNIRVQPVGCDGVGNDRAAGILLQGNIGSHSDQAVAVNFFAVFVHSAAAVHIGIKNHTQIGPGLFNSLANAGHSLGVFRVGNMVREHAVRFQKLAAGNIGPQRRQHILGIETACAVTGIDDNMEPTKRVFVIVCLYPFFDPVTQ